jgi:hypothetical protein
VQGLSLSRVCQVECDGHGIKPSELGLRGSPHPARDVLAHRARRYTEATNAELAVVLGLSPAEGVPSLTRRIAGWLTRNHELPKRPRLVADELTRGIASQKT